MITSTFPPLDASGVPARETLAARFRILMRAPGRTMRAIDAMRVEIVFEDGIDAEWFGNAMAACAILRLTFRWTNVTITAKTIIVTLVRFS